MFVGSWNMGDAGPPPDITSWIQSLGLGKTLPGALLQAHDIYAFGTQVREGRGGEGRGGEGRGGEGRGRRGEGRKGSMY